MATASTNQAIETPSLETEVNRRIVMLMWDAKMTQTSLAAELDLMQSGLSKKLHGRTGWGIDELATAARVLRSTVAYLVGETSEPHFPVGPTGFEPMTSTVEEPEFAPDWKAPVIQLFGAVA